MRMELYGYYEQWETRRKNDILLFHSKEELTIDSTLSPGNHDICACYQIFLNYTSSGVWEPAPIYVLFFMCVVIAE